jgi:hypothetical protein
VIIDNHIEAVHHEGAPEPVDYGDAVGVGPGECGRDDGLGAGDIVVA